MLAHLPLRPVSFLLVLSRDRARRVAAADARLEMLAARKVPLGIEPPWAWPLTQHLCPALPTQAHAALSARDLHAAFPAGQTDGTRLILTQSTYQLQRWLDWLATHPDCAVVADADPDELARRAPDVVERRGPWRDVEMVDADADTDTPLARTASAATDLAPGETPDLAHRLVATFATGTADARLSACEEALRERPEAAAIHLMHGSALIELGRWDAAHDAIARAAAIAPAWEAVHFELGKLWLRIDAIERAVEAFAEAGRLMPTFTAAFTNLGGALGELERDDDALAALHHARRYDPDGYAILNNIGVIARNAGRLEEAEAAFLRVIALAPTFIFGRYNLAHTRFLQGRFPEAWEAYHDAISRDPQRSPRQRARAAIAAVAAGSVELGERLLTEVGETLEGQERRDVMAEAEQTLGALATLPDLDARGIQNAQVIARRYST